MRFASTSFAVSAIALIALPLNLANATGSSCYVPSVPCSVAAPGPAYSAGYCMNTFSTNSNFSAATVDMGETFASGFQWYAFNFNSNSPSVANVTLNGDGSVTAGASSASYNTGTLLSVGYNNTYPGNWVGTAFGGGAYIQATVKFTPGNLPSANNWPAFWSTGLEGLLQTSHWSGQATGYQHFIEVDLMEYFEGEFSQSLNSYQGNLHDWYGQNGALSNYNVSFTSNQPQSAYSSYHTYGMLWIPATSTTNGTLTFYFDGTSIGSQSYTQFTTQSPPPSASTPWAFGIIDSQHLYLQFNSNNTYPITVQSVSVWQASTANDLHQ